VSQRATFIMSSVQNLEEVRYTMALSHSFANIFPGFHKKECIQLLVRICSIKVTTSGLVWKAEGRGFLRKTENLFRPLHVQGCPPTFLSTSGGLSWSGIISSRTGRSSTTLTFLHRFPYFRFALSSYLGRFPRQW